MPLEEADVRRVVGRPWDTVVVVLVEDEVDLVLG